MKPTPYSLSRWQGTALALIAAASLTACGGGGSTVTAIPQTITSLSVSAAEVAGGTANLSAQASSGLTSFTYASSTPATCTVSNAVLSFVSAGTCTVQVTQAGNANFSSASTSFNFAVSGAVQPTITYSSGFAAGNLTVEGGAYGGYSGSNQDGYNCNGQPNWCGGGTGAVSNTVTAANSYSYYYYQTPTPATALYMGLYMLAPSVTALSNSADTNGVSPPSSYKLNFKLNQNPEWYNSTTNNFAVQLTLGKHYTSGGAACNIKLAQIVTPTSANATAYSLPLSSFTVTQDCGTGINTVDNALAASPKVSQIDFQGFGGGSKITLGTRNSGANLSVPTGGVYPTTIALTGGITFTP